MCGHRTTIIFTAALLFLSACASDAARPAAILENTASTEIGSPQIRKLLENAIEQTRTTRGYTQDYFVIGYPN
ncbi:MAG TPA: hypothetical protein VLA17_10260, partial [Candidatus Limnocylindria bacterium]|nr:hypothetical protein [Candidatus Limnocylindria bacterium]